MTDIHSEVKGLKVGLQLNNLKRNIDINNGWKELISIVNNHKNENNNQWKNIISSDNISDFKSPLKLSFGFRTCNSCGKPINCSSLLNHLKNHCKMVIDKTTSPVTNIKKELSPIKVKMKKNSSSDLETSPLKKQRKSTTPIPKKLRKVKQRNPTEPHLVDLNKQCGVELLEGGVCGRSLTCKSHSMGAKRSVKGRTQPFDILLADYQKKNQLKTTVTISKPRTKLQQSQNQKQNQKQKQIQNLVKNISSDIPLLTPEEETTRVLSGVSRSFPLPLENTILSSIRTRTKYLRMREMFASAFSIKPGYSSPGYGAIRSRVGCLDLDKTTDYTFRIRTPQPIPQPSHNFVPQQVQSMQQQKSVQHHQYTQQSSISNSTSQNMIIQNVTPQDIQTQQLMMQQQQQKLQQRRRLDDVKPQSDVASDSMRTESPIGDLNSLATGASVASSYINIPVTNNGQKNKFSSELDN